MDVQTKVHDTRSFEELSQIADRAEVKLSFWGNVHIAVAGHEGQLDCDALAAKTMGLLKQLKYEFSEQERIAGTRLAGKIEHLYRDISAQLGSANFFIKTLRIVKGIAEMFFDWISGGHSFYFGELRDFGISSIQYEWHGILLQDTNDDFSFYTEKQLQTVFGISREEAERRGYRHEEKNGIHRWMPR